MDDACGNALPSRGEKSAHARPDWISRLLADVAYRAARHPGRTLALALLLTAMAALLTVTSLEFRTSRLDLLSDSAGYNQRWLNYLAKFGHDDDAVVVVSHTDPKRVADVLTIIGGRLESDPQLTGVLYRKSVGAVADKALQLMPVTELEQLDQLLQASLSLSNRGQGLQNQVVPAASSAVGGGQVSTGALAPMAQQLSAAVTQAQHGLDQLQQAVPEQGPLLLEDEGKLGICLVRLPHADDKPDEAAALLTCLHSHLNAVRSQNGDVDVWLTGMPVLEWDESQSSQRDMQNATLLSLIGVAIVFVFGFGSWRMPCAAVLCLAMALLWTVGLTTLCIGHLNLFSVAFGAIIAGLGIDYAIHLLTRLQADGQDEASDDLPRVLAGAVGKCGRGVFTGAVTTAAAFAVAMLTPFRGMTELGAICAMGTLCCMAVTIWILPALLAFQADHWPAHPADPARRGFIATFHTSTIRWLGRVNDQVLNHRRAVLLGVSAVTLLAAMRAGQMHYDHNLLNLQADDVPSVHAERELTRRSGQSAWFAISLANSPQHALEMRRRLANLPSVARVEEVGSVIASALTHPQTGALVAACRAHAEQLAHQIALQRSRSPATSPAALATSLPTGEGQLVLPASHTFSADFQPDLAAQLQLLASSVMHMATGDALTLADFPSAVRERMASQDGQTFLLRIFARENLWQRENLGRFVGEVESVDPHVTGHPIQTWYASGELENSYYQAGIYAFLAVTALLMIDLGSVRLVLLALIPVALSSLQLCGLMVWMNVPFNAANMIVLPLILGIGVDDGVHIVHDFHARGDKRFRISSGTTLAVLLTSLTTMIGFGSMGIADHRGLQSLGIVLLLGVGLCLLNSWFTLPALLSYIGPQTTRSASRAKPARTVDAANATAVAKRDAKMAIDSDQPSATPRDPARPLRDIPVLLSLPNYPEAVL